MQPYSAYKEREKNPCKLKALAINVIEHHETGKSILLVKQIKGFLHKFSFTSIVVLDS